MTPDVGRSLGSGATFGAGGAADANGLEI